MRVSVRHVHCTHVGPTNSDCFFFFFVFLLIFIHFKAMEKSSSVCIYLCWSIVALHYHKSRNNFALGEIKSGSVPIAKNTNSWHRGKIVDENVEKKNARQCLFVIFIHMWSQLDRAVYLGRRRYSAAMATPTTNRRRHIHTHTTGERANSNRW